MGIAMMPKCFKKVICAICCMGILSAFVYGAEVKNKPAAKNSSPKKATQTVNTLTFLGEKYRLKYSTGNSQQWINEYLLNNENFKSYTKMVAVRSYDALQSTPKQMISSMAANYQRQHPNVRFSVFEGANGDFGMGFFMLEGRTMEHNLYRATTVNGHLILIQFVYREYAASEQRSTQELQTMGQHVKQNLPLWKQELLSMPVPPINKTVILE